MAEIKSRVFAVCTTAYSTTQVKSCRWKKAGLSVDEWLHCVRQHNPNQVASPEISSQPFYSSSDMVQFRKLRRPDIAQFICQSWKRSRPDPIQHRGFMQLAELFNRRRTKCLIDGLAGAQSRYDASVAVSSLLLIISRFQVVSWKPRSHRPGLQAGFRLRMASTMLYFAFAYPVPSSSLVYTILLQ